MLKTYIGLSSTGTTLIFTDMNAIEEFGIENYFELTEPLPEGKGIIRTDGISKVWREEVADESKSFIQEIIDQI